jgi:membrane protease YdiL (CAAX protease family)
MSLLMSSAPAAKRITTLSSATWFAVYFVTVMIGGAILGGWLIRFGLQSDSGFWHDFILEHGPSRILRRFQTVFAVLMAPWMLKKIGWGGIHDVGWSSRQLRKERQQDFVRWFLLGLLAMVVIFTISMLSGVREWREISAGGLILSIIKGFLITGIGVGIIEETLTRGVLYRTLAKAWSPWSAALISSLLFAWAHFMKSTPESFEQGIPAIVLSSLFADFAKEVVPLKFLNMLAFGIVLSRLVYYRGDIWAAVGLHAAAVGAIKVFSKLTEFVPEAGYQSWIGGHSSRFDDGWMLTLMLFIFFCLIEFRNRPLTPSSRVYH